MDEFLRNLFHLGQPLLIGDEDGGEGNLGGGAADDGANADGAGDEGGDTGTGSTAGKTAAAATGEDPTAGMSPEDALQYWRDQADSHKKRAGHFESEYKRERTKRQEFQRKGAGTGTAAATADAGKGTAAGKPDFNKMNVEDFDRYLEEKFQGRFLSREQLAAEKSQWNFEQSENAARQRYANHEFFPDYDEVVDEYVAPLVEKYPDTWQLLQRFDDPGAATYLLGMLQKFQTPEALGEFFEAKGRKALVNKINTVTQQVVRGKGGGKPVSSKGKMTAEDVWNLDSNKFEEEIERAKAQD